MSVNYCGLSCECCPTELRSMCRGCRQTGGAPFWGRCQVASCCQRRRLKHCGECNHFACHQLKHLPSETACNDRGRRLDVLEGLRTAGQPQAARTPAPIVEGMPHPAPEASRPA
jgi:hypothetical protein